MEYNIGRNAIKITVKDVVLSTNSKCLLKCIKSDSVTSVCQKSRESQQHFIRSLYQQIIRQMSQAEGVHLKKCEVGMWSPKCLSEILNEKMGPVMKMPED